MNGSALSPRVRPAEWNTALVAFVVAITLWASNRDTGALVAAVIGIIPPIVTLLVEKLNLPETMRPTEIVTAILGLIGAGWLFVNNRDVAALTAAMTAFLPAIVTLLVYLGSRNEPAPPEPV